jgi:DNA-binding NarL/FixJ family response regulator
MDIVDRSPWRVVIADDDDALRALLRATLEREDRFLVVGEARDGLEALDEVSRSDPDLLLLDLAMPRMDGHEVLEKLAPEPRPTVVVLTGLDDDLVARTLRAGAACYLEKGSAFDGLCDALAQALLEHKELNQAGVESVIGHQA